MPDYSSYFIAQGYVGNIKEILFSKSEKELIAINKKYAAKVPQPLNSQFPDRKLKDEAIKQQRKRKQTEAELFPSGTIKKLFIPCQVYSIDVAVQNV